MREGDVSDSAFFVCGRSRSRGHHCQEAHCDRPADVSCDWMLFGSAGGRYCNRKLCRGHAVVVVAGEKHYCAAHAKLAREARVPR